MRPYYVYMVRCSDGTYYTGITTDLVRREREHNGEVRGGATYTRSRRPVVLVYHEVCTDRSTASKREYVLRHLPRHEKETLAL